MILRHDVDRIPANALAMAELEHRLGIKSTYYVRTVPSVLSPKLVRRLHELGHEIGYHYEVLSKCGGNTKKALELFANELGQLRRLAPVTTASAHGSPLSGWNNLGIWETADPTDFGLAGEAYLQIDYAQVGYYTDTGRRWDAVRTNLRDRVESHGETFPTVRTTDELIALVESRRFPTLCIQTHPERWNATVPGFVRSALLDRAANTAKNVIRLVRARDAG